MYHWSRHSQLGIPGIIRITMINNHIENSPVWKQHQSVWIFPCTDEQKVGNKVENKFPIFLADVVVNERMNACWIGCFVVPLGLDEEGIGIVVGGRNGHCCPGDECRRWHQLIDDGLRQNYIVDAIWSFFVVWNWYLSLPHNSPMQIPTMHQKWMPYKPTKIMDFWLD